MAFYLRRQLIFKLILFADDTSIITSYLVIDYLQNCVNDGVTGVNKWFKDSNLTLNFIKKLAVEPRFCRL
jgi:hypothetical protein